MRTVTSILIERQERQKEWEKILDLHNLLVRLNNPPKLLTNEEAEPK